MRTGRFATLDGRGSIGCSLEDGGELASGVVLKEGGAESPSF